MPKPVAIKEQILTQLRNSGPLGVASLVRRCKISRQALHRHLRSLLDERKILRTGRTRQVRYVLNTPGQIKPVFGISSPFRRTYTTRGLEEDRCLQDLKLSWPSYRRLSSNAGRLLDFAFAEMVNNVIDHSASPDVRISVTQHGPDVTFDVMDRGVGIYNRLMEKFRLAEPMEAIQELLKGKATTWPERHSGEGIFFTSRSADFFTIASDRWLVAFDNRRSDVYVKTIRKQCGTIVHFEIATDTSKSPEEVFSEYSVGEFAFDKTKVQVKLFQGSAPYVSRSEARRLLVRCDQFREVILDFAGVETIGQAFADEVFRVFQSQHPETNIRAINANPTVAFMIAHVRSDKTS